VPLIPPAHVAGVPVEETLLAAGPAIAVWAGLAAGRLRRLVRRATRRDDG
jgi:hypothetical protein